MDTRDIFGRMGAVVGIIVILLIVAFAIWTGRPKNKGGNGDNREAAMRYGPGAHGG
jgi:hypothetical protein